MTVKVEDFTGSNEVSDIACLEEILKRRDGAGYNSFWMSHGNHKYPSLSLLVCGSLATLHYFPRESHPGFVPAGNIAALEKGHLTTFHMDKNGEEVEILNEAVVLADEGSEVAREFFLSPTLPARIKWSEL